MTILLEFSQLTNSVLTKNNELKDDVASEQPKFRVVVAVVAQLVRALDCGSKCRGFESRRSPIFFS